MKTSENSILTQIILEDHFSVLLPLFIYFQKIFTYNLFCKFSLFTILLLYFTIFYYCFAALLKNKYTSYKAEGTNNYATIDPF